jgi:hypothetical protein
MIAFLLTPIGRYIAIGITLLIVISGAYLKVRSDIEAEMEAEAAQEIIRRTNEAVRAGDHIDVSPDGLRHHDRFERD